MRERGEKFILHLASAFRFLSRGLLALEKLLAFGRHRTDFFDLIAYLVLPPAGAESRLNRADDRPNRGGPLQQRDIAERGKDMRSPMRLAAALHQGDDRNVGPPRLLIERRDQLIHPIRGEGVFRKQDGAGAAGELIVELAKPAADDALHAGTRH